MNQRCSWEDVWGPESLRGLRFNGDLGVGGVIKDEEEFVFNFDTFSKLRRGAIYLAQGPIPTVAMVAGGRAMAYTIKATLHDKERKLQIQN